MEARTTAWSIVALVIIVFGSVVIYSIQNERIKTELSRTRLQLDDQRTAFAGQAGLLEARKAEYTALQAGAAAIARRVEARQSLNEEAAKHIETLRSAWAEERRLFAEDIDLIQARAKDDTMPELRLVDGQILKSAHFREFRNGMVILEHAGGVADVPLANMNQDWMGRLAIGWNPRLSPELAAPRRAPAPETPAVAAEPPAPVSDSDSDSATTVMASMPAARSESAKRTDVTDLENRVQALTQEISDARNEIEKLNTSATDHNAKYINASSKRSMSSHRTKRDQALRSARSLMQRITNAQSQIEQLMEEIRSKSS